MFKSSGCRLFKGLDLGEPIVRIVRHTCLRGQVTETQLELVKNKTWKLLAGNWEVQRNMECRYGWIWGPHQVVRVLALLSHSHIS